MHADVDRLRRVRALLDELGAGHVPVRLTDKDSHARRSGELRIKRDDADVRDEALRGLIGHEYAHLIDPHRRRDHVLPIAGLGVASIGALIALVS